MTRVNPFLDREVRQLMYMRARGDVTDVEFYRLMGHHNVSASQFVRAYLGSILIWRIIPWLAIAVVSLTFVGFIYFNNR